MRVGRRVGLVEAVARELVDQLEDVGRLLARHALLHRARHELGLLPAHDGLVFLAHGLAQDVGLAQRVAGHHLGDLQHLLLVDDDAVGLLQDRLQHGMEIVDRLLAVLPVDVGRDVVHGARPIERGHGHDVLEAVGLQPLQALADTGAFQLEHADRVRLRQQLVGLAVVERDLQEIDVDAAAALDQGHGLLQHGERLEAQEVELHEARRLHQLPIVLRDGEARLGIAVEGNELVERPVADHHAGRVRRGVAVEPLELAGDLEQPRHHRLAVAGFLQLGLAVDGLLQRHRVGRVVGNELAELVDLPVGHLQHAPHVAQHGAGLQLAVRDDLRHAVGAVFLLHVADHLVAPVLAEVDVEIGHRHALGVQEALEQQAEAQGIEVGDGERPGHHRAGARAAAWSHGDAVGLGPLDEVGDDQEVAGKLHLRDHVDLEGQPLLRSRQR